MFDIVYFFCWPLLFDHYQEDWICHLAIVPCAEVCTREQARYSWIVPSVCAIWALRPFTKLLSVSRLILVFYPLCRFLQYENWFHKHNKRENTQRGCCIIVVPISLTSYVSLYTIMAHSRVHHAVVLMLIWGVSALLASPCTGYNACPGAGSAGCRGCGREFFYPLVIEEC